MRTFWLPFGYDVSEEIFDRCMEQNEIIKACFVGNPDKKRADFFNNLADLGVSLDIYGNGWGEFTMNRNIVIYDAVYEENFWITLCKYRIQLNILRPHNINSHSMRSFEIPGAGGIQLTQRTKEHEAFFVEKNEIFFYNNIDDCAEKINILLKMKAEDARTIRVLARTRCETSDYSYAFRTKQLLNYLNKL